MTTDGTRYPGWVPGHRVDKLLCDRCRRLDAYLSVRVAGQVLYVCNTCWARITDLGEQDCDY